MLSFIVVIATAVFSFASENDCMGNDDEFASKQLQATQCFSCLFSLLVGVETVQQRRIHFLSVDVMV